MKKIIFITALLLGAGIVRGQDKDWKPLPFSGSFDSRGVTFGIAQGAHTFLQLGYDHCMGRWSRCAFGNGFMSTTVTAEYDPVQKVWGAGMGMMNGGMGIICLGLWGGIYQHSGKDAFFLPYFRPGIGLGNHRFNLGLGFNFLFGRYRFENTPGVNTMVVSLRYFLPILEKETPDL
jgi:hypothetical protein